MRQLAEVGTGADQFQRVRPYRWVGVVERMLIRAGPELWEEVHTIQLVLFQRPVEPVGLALGVGEDVLWLKADAPACMEAGNIDPLKAHVPGDCQHPL